MNTTVECEAMQGLLCMMNMHLPFTSFTEHLAKMQTAAVRLIPIMKRSSATASNDQQQ